MSTITVQASQAQAVRDAYSAWRPARDGTSVAQLPQGGETASTVEFSWVPEEFLTVLDDAGIPYSKRD